MHAIKRTKKQHFYEDNHDSIIDLPMHVSIVFDYEDIHHSRHDKRPSHAAQNATILFFFGGLFQCRSH